MRGSFSDLGDTLIGWFAAIGWCVALGATAWGYGYTAGKKDVRVWLEPGTTCRVNVDGSRLCAAPFVSEKPAVEMRRLQNYRRKAV